MHYLNLQRRHFPTHLLNLTGGEGAANAALIRDYLADNAADNTPAIFDNFPRQGLMAMDYPVILPSHSVFNGNGLRVVNENMTETQELSCACFVIGNEAPTDADNYVYHPLSAVKAGDNILRQIEVMTEPGHIVHIVEAHAGFGVGGVHPLFGQYLTVTGVDATYGRLSGPIERDIAAGAGTMGQDATGAWVAIKSTGYSHSTPSNLLVPQHMVENVEVTDVEVLNHVGPWMYRTGARRLRMENIHVQGSTAGFMANSLDDAHIHNLSGEVGERVVEVKNMSRNVFITGVRMNYNTSLADQSGAPETPISFGERASAIRLADVKVEMGKAQLNGNSDDLMRVDKANDVVVHGVTFTGASSFQTAIVQGPDCDDTSFDKVTVNCGPPRGNWLSLGGDRARVLNSAFLGNGKATVVRLTSAFKSGFLLGNYWSKPGQVQDDSTGVLTAQANQGLNLGGLYND